MLKHIQFRIQKTDLICACNCFCNCLRYCLSIATDAIVKFWKGFVFMQWLRRIKHRHMYNAPRRCYWCWRTVKNTTESIFPSESIFSKMSPNYNIRVTHFVRILLTVLTIRNLSKFPYDSYCLSGIAWKLHWINMISWIYLLDSVDCTKYWIGVVKMKRHFD